ncbi:eif-2-alpha kinase activator gcn1 [Anaeramoeba ignava]|uniref:Eif-2-alpha kinase activator gcn1 n=1 Tax=Anaeramoeba ignava TaxID=1746090 RepID=A0A9Q0LF84_ANAIG|nr:eif-2-alpha kinase activator gcn1 [Anaeramoeba ignava]
MDSNQILKEDWKQFLIEGWKFITASSVLKRKEIILNLMKCLSMSETMPMPDKTISFFSKLIFSTLAIYHERESRLIIEKLIEELVKTKFKTKSSKFFVLFFLNMVNPKNPIPKQRYIQLRWTCIALEKLPEEELKSFNDKENAFLLSLFGSLLTSLIYLPNKKLATLSFNLAKHCFYNTKIPILLINALKNFEDYRIIHPLIQLFSSVLIEKNKEIFINELKPKLLEIYTKNILQSRSQFQHKVLDSYSTLLKNITEKDFSEILLPVITRIMNRNPETAIHHLLPLFQTLELDLDAHFSENLLPIVIAEIKSENQQQKKLAFSMFRAIFKTMQNKEEMKKGINVLQEIMNQPSHWETRHTISKCLKIIFKSQHGADLFIDKIESQHLQQMKKEKEPIILAQMIKSIAYAILKKETISENIQKQFIQGLKSNDVQQNKIYIDGLSIISGSNSQNFNKFFLSVIPFFTKILKKDLSFETFVVSPLIIFKMAKYSEEISAKINSESIWKIILDSHKTRNKIEQLKLDRKQILKYSSMIITLVTISNEKRSAKNADEDLDCWKDENYHVLFERIFEMLIDPNWEIRKNVRNQVLRLQKDNEVISSSLLSSGVMFLERKLTEMIKKETEKAKAKILIKIAAKKEKNKKEEEQKTQKTQESQGKILANLLELIATEKAISEQDSRVISALIYVASHPRVQEPSLWFKINKKKVLEEKVQKLNVEVHKNILTKMKKLIEILEQNDESAIKETSEELEALANSYERISKFSWEHSVRLIVNDITELLKEQLQKINLLKKEDIDVYKMSSTDFENFLQKRTEETKNLRIKELKEKLNNEKKTKQKRSRGQRDLYKVEDEKWEEELRKEQQVKKIKEEESQMAKEIYTELSEEMNKTRRKIKGMENAIRVSLSILLTPCNINSKRFYLEFGQSVAKTVFNFMSSIVSYEQSNLFINKMMSGIPSNYIKYRNRILRGLNVLFANDLCEKIEGEPNIREIMRSLVSMIYSECFNEMTQKVTPLDSTTFTLVYPFARYILTLPYLYEVHEKCISLVFFHTDPKFVIARKEISGHLLQVPENTPNLIEQTQKCIVGLFEKWKIIEDLEYIFEGLISTSSVIRIICLQTLLKSEAMNIEIEKIKNEMVLQNQIMSENNENQIQNIKDTFQYFDNKKAANIVISSYDIESEENRKTAKIILERLGFLEFAGSKNMKKFDDMIVEICAHLSSKDLNIREMSAQAIAEVVNMSNSLEFLKYIFDGFTKVYMDLMEKETEDRSTDDLGIEVHLDNEDEDEKSGDENENLRKFGDIGERYLELRHGIAVALKYMAQRGLFSTENMICDALEFLITKDHALSESIEEIQKELLDLGTELVDKNPKESVSQGMKMMQDFLARKPENTIEDDKMREGALIILGAMAKYETDMKKLEQIFKQLLDGLVIPSEIVQSTISRCVSSLVPKITSELVDSSMNFLLQSAIQNKKYGIRRGASYGIAGMVLGLKITSLTKYGILEKIEEAGKSPSGINRQGGLTLIEILCLVLGNKFQPYLSKILSQVLNAYGDSDSSVAKLAEQTSRAMFTILQKAGVKSILPLVISGLDNESWKTKIASIEMLGTVAFCAPKQLSQTMPMVVPLLVNLIRSPRQELRKSATKSLKSISEVIQNKEIKEHAPALLSALEDPSKHLKNALDALLYTTFVNYIDAPSLALVFPTVLYGLNQGQTEIKKSASRVVGSLCSLSRPKDIQPYISTILPKLKQLLSDPIPEVRGDSALALSKLVRGLGMEQFPSLLEWLLQRIKTTEGHIERSGSAQALAHILGVIGIEKLDQLLPGFVTSITSQEAPIEERDGSMSLLRFLPMAFRDGLHAHVDTVLRAAIKGLSDESELVRDTAMRTGIAIIEQYSQSGLSSLLSQFEVSVFDQNPRIRINSLELVGQLLYRVSFSTIEKKEANYFGDDIFIKPIIDSENTNESIEKIPKNEKKKSKKKIKITRSKEKDDYTQDVLLNALGEEKFKRILAVIHISRCDENMNVKRAASLLWNRFVTNPAKTLRQITPTVLKTTLEMLQIQDIWLKKLAGATIGDLIRKMGSTILTSILPLFDENLESPDPSIRQGACIGLSEVIYSSGKPALSKFMDRIVKYVRIAICDLDESVSDESANTFDALYSVFGSMSVNAVLPEIISMIADPESRERGLMGLQKILLKRGSVVLSYLVPHLLYPKVDFYKALAIEKLVGVIQENLPVYIDKFIPSLVEAIAIESIDETKENIKETKKTKKSKKNLKKSKDELTFESQKIEIPKEIISKEQLSTQATKAANALVVAVPSSGATKLLSALFKLFSHKNQAYQLASIQLLSEFCKNPNIKLGNHLEVIFKAVFPLFTNKNEKASTAAWNVISVITKTISVETISNHFHQIKDTITQLVMSFNIRLPNEEKIPGFSVPNAFVPLSAPIIWGISEGMNDIKEQAAILVEKFATYSQIQYSKMLLMKFLGPLIRIAPEKITLDVKISILSAILCILKKSGPLLKPYFVPIQSTFIRSINSSSMKIHSIVLDGLTILSQHQQRPESLLIEFYKAIEPNSEYFSSDTVVLQDSILIMLRNIIRNAGAKIKDDILLKFMQFFIKHTSSSESSFRKSLAKTYGVFFKFIKDKKTKFDQINEIIENVTNFFSKISNQQLPSDLDTEQGLIAILFFITKYNASFVQSDDLLSKKIAHVVFQLLQAEKIPNQQFGTKIAFKLLSRNSSDLKKEISEQLISLITKNISSKSSEVSTTSMQFFRKISAENDYYSNFELPKIAEPILTIAKSINIDSNSRMIAARALIAIFRFDKDQQVIDSYCKNFPKLKKNNLVEFLETLLLKLKQNNFETSDSDGEKLESLEK